MCNKAKFFWYLYRSRNSNNLYPLEIGSLFCRVSDLIYEPEKVRAACVTGCKNYNRAGGCPPWAPKLESFAEPGELVWLICCRFWSKFKPENVASSRNPAIHWKFQDAILARFLANIGYQLISVTGGSFLSTGYCMGCPGKKCNFKLGLNYCRNPGKRTFSMEATGINVVETVYKLFGLKMYWYSRGKIDVPYMLKCIAVFPGKKVKMDLLISTLNKFTSCDCAIGSTDYRKKLSFGGLLDLSDGTKPTLKELAKMMKY